MPFPAAELEGISFSHQHDASGTSGRNSDGKLWQGSNGFWRRPGVGNEVSTARDAGPVIPEWTETAGMSSANEDSLRRKALHLVREGLESDLDDSPPHHGCKPVQDEVKSAPGSDTGRRRQAAPVQ